MVNADDFKTQTGWSIVLTIPSVESNSVHIKVEPELQLDSSADHSGVDVSCTSLPNAPRSASYPNYIIHVPENSK
jgi:hypothetical protein